MPIRLAMAMTVIALGLLPLSVGGRGLSGSGPRSNQIEPVPVSATAVLVVDLTTGIEIYASNADQALPPASTMKIVTALVAKSILPLDTQVTIQEGDLLDPTVYSNMQLQAGDIVDVATLLHGVLIPSGADAALALAREAGLRLEPGTTDPVGRFVAEMNTWAVQHGMSHSHFTNPVGADDPENVASARDLVRAAEALVNDRLLARIVELETYVASVTGPAVRDIHLVNSNEFISRDDVFGIKTGTEDLAGQCLITGFWRGDNRIISVVLGSEDRYWDTQVVMDAVDGTYRWLALGIGATSQGATEALAERGMSFQMRRTVLMRVDQAEQITWEIMLDSQPRGERLGEVIFRLDDRVVARMSIYSISSGAIGPDAA